MKSFGRHKDEPQASTPAIVAALMVFLLNPFSASAKHYDNTSFNFPSFGYESLKLLDIQGDASVLPPYLNLSVSQPNGNLKDISGRATYSGKVHLWDEATGNAADFTTQYTFSIDSQQRETFGDGFPFFVAPCNSSMSSNLGGGNLALPKGSYVGVETDTYKNPWDPDTPHIGIDLNDHRSAANITVPWLTDKIMNGGSVRASITYDSRARNLSVVLVDGDGNSSNSVSLHYAPLSLRDYLPEWVVVGFSAATGAQYEYHTIHSWQYSCSLPLAPEKVTDPWMKWVLIVMGGVLGLVILIALRIAWVSFKPEESNAPKTTEENKTDPERGGEEGGDIAKLTEELEKLSGPKKFSYEELTIATNSFADGWILGKGGFGYVYKGHIGDAGTQVVAVKVISSDSQQGMKEYMSEVLSISQLRHRNLVHLIGYCHEVDKFVLVYEFMSEGSLDDHLFNGRSLLTWARRYNIARGLASVLHYMHEQWKKCVIHRDIKSSNTMLDEKFEAKLGDFGLARLVDHAKGQKTTQLKGTPGYLAPECFQTGKASKESDVFSFGVVLLEIVCGRRVIGSAQADQGQKSLVESVWKQYGRRKLLDAVDSRLGRNFDKKEAKALMMAGLWCAHPIASSRPSIKAAMDVLNLNANLPNLPSNMPKSQHIIEPKVSSRCFWL